MLYIALYRCENNIDAEGALPVQHIHTFLVHPRKGAETSGTLNGSSLPLSGKMFKILNEIYIGSDKECDVDIIFVSKDGAQENDCRTLICGYVENPTIQNAELIARRLEEHTDARSRMGLLFLMIGQEGKEKKLVLSRFPTDNAIYVEESSAKLDVKFLERVFMKNKSSYKAVLYKGPTTQSGFWQGTAVDRQNNAASGVTSEYWISDFLASQYRVTSYNGTRRLAAALKAVATKAELPIQQEIVAATTLAKGLLGQQISAADFCQRFSLSPEATEAVLKELKSPRIAQEKFVFNLEEFRASVAFRAVSLSNGATITAPSADFDSVVNQESLGKDGKIRFTTEGKIVEQRLKQNV
jgi:hypothetical protein